MQLLPGFRDFFPEDCARKNYILSCWREVARRYGFVEYDGPVVESLPLYEKKSGGELVGQMFTVGATAEPGVLKGALRPEMTPTLARMVAARARDFRKPLKWFSVPNCFRHERQGRGRLREFYQLNCDIIGEPSPAADAELLAMVIDTLRSFGLGQEDFVVRVSDRNAWTQFASARGVSEERLLDFLAVIDKLERATPQETESKLQDFGISLEAVKAFLRDPAAEATGLKAISEDLTARGLNGYLELDLTIVRGLAYYTGFVFEIFDRKKKERALAGGGRYDKLLSLMSDGKVDLPALGFGMGDVVLANLIDDTASAKTKMAEWIAKNHSADVYAIIANEDCRPQALGIIQELRQAGYRVDYPLTAAKIGKQFQNAEHLGALVTVLFGEEWPQVKVKTLASRQELLIEHAKLAGTLRELLPGS